MENAVTTGQKEASHLARLGAFLKDSWKDYLVLLLIAAIAISLDQWTKSLVRDNIPLGTDWLPEWLSWLSPYARIRHWYNTGAAFGIFQNGNLVFSILAIIVSCLILYYYPRVARQEWWMRLALGLQFSGAVGNLIDRLTIKHVTDFISVGGFAIFNVADSCISVGVAVLVLGVWLKERAQKKEAAAAAAVDEAKGE